MFCVGRWVEMTDLILEINFWSVHRVWNCQRSVYFQPHFLLRNLHWGSKTRNLDIFKQFQEQTFIWNMFQITNSLRCTVLKRMRALKRSFRKSSDLKGERAGKVKTLVEHTTSPCFWARGNIVFTSTRSTASQWWAGPLYRTGSDKWVAGKRRPIPGSPW